MSSERVSSSTTSLTRRLVVMGVKLAVSIALLWLLFSRIDGDVVRVADSAKVTRSKTLAATVVLADRTMGMMGLVLVAAAGVTLVTSGGRTPLPIWPSWLWAGFTSGMLLGALMLWAPGGVGWILRPLLVLHPEWVAGRIGSITTTLQRFRNHVGAV